MSRRIPDSLRCPQIEEAVARWQLAAADSAVDPSAADTDEDTTARLAWLFAVSPYLMHLSRRQPDAFIELSAAGAVDLCSPDALEAALLEAAGQPAEDAGQMAALRRFRHRCMVRILIDELERRCDVWQSLGRLSALADACLRVAACWAHEAISARYGEPCDAQGQPMRLLVLGMGKLGGGELNVSSDVDLIYLYREGGATDGRRSIDNTEFFRRVAQRLSKLLSAVTEDSFAYRVDTRLRPFGESGPLAVSFEALEHYLLTQARDWERYAMIKARAVVGQTGDVQQLQGLLTPFVYRRYLDYSAIDALRDLKRKIALSVRQRGLQGNIKLGAGGIREVEFIVQAFQLVRGGREASLRERSIRRVLPALGELGMLTGEEVDRLCEAYVFLRRTENALQAMRDQQVHSLPVDAQDRQRLVSMLGFADWAGFLAAIEAVRATVSDQFSRLFNVAGEEATTISTASGAEQEAWARFGTPDFALSDSAALLEELGIEPVEGLPEALSELCRGSFYERLAAHAKQRVECVVPLLLELVPASATRAGASSGMVLLRSARFVRAVAGRSGYLQVLVNHQEALARLTDLFAHSSWIAEFVTRHPIVLDELVGPSANRPVLDRDALLLATSREVERIREADLETQMDALRQFRNAHVLHVACAEIDGTLGIMQVSDQLSWLAEALVGGVLELVTPPLEARFGKPTCVIDGQHHQPELGIIAYGKLGGIELGYGSDLDLVFLHDSSGSAQQTDGPSPVENSVFYARLARAFAGFMSTLTPAGTLYEIDMRLRPNGRAGLLVTAIDAFERYQREDAWTWEHQALVRARAVAGADRLHRRFDATRASVLQQPREREQLQHDVAAMRQRMRDSLASAGGDTMDLKQDPGGVVDIEFLVQFLVLAHAAEHSELLCYTDNIRLLGSLGEAGLLDPAVAANLQSCYRKLRIRLHRQALQQLQGSVALDPELQALRERVQQLCESQFPSGEAAS